MTIATLIVTLSVIRFYISYIYDTHRLLRYCCGLLVPIKSNILYMKTNSNITKSEGLKKKKITLATD